jgi:short-subunit dehydrogenase
MSLLARLLYPSVVISPKEVSMALEGKTILITGATFGIGEGLVRRLMHYNVHLILVARTSEKLSILEDESQSLPAQVTTLTCDLNVEANINELCKNLKSVRIDYFISNAGKSTIRSLRESRSRFDDYKKTIAVNYLAPVQLILTLMEVFSKARTHIVNVSTYNVLMNTPPKWSAYVSSKKAMYSWFNSNMPELVLMNITLSNIYLPLVESRMKDANKNYKDTPAMHMDTAVAIIIKGLIKRRYHFKPWWHVPFQIVLFLLNPFWHRFWQGRIRQEKQ